MDQNVVHPLRIPSDVLHELEESLILCDTGISHESGEIHNDQKQQIEQDHIRKIIESNVGLTYQIRNHLLRGKLTQFGRSLNEAWLFKRQFSSKISSIRLDQIYEDAIEHGAIGGKLLGAGGGGFFLFYVLPFRKYELIEALEARGLAIKSFRFEQDGLRAWSVRESRHLQEIHSI